MLTARPADAVCLSNKLGSNKPGSAHPDSEVPVPYGAFINALPPAFFLAVHLIGFLVGAFCAYRAFERTAAPLGWGSACTPLPSLCI